ncbi:unnamed protein product [Moneuplotes crassus]|uniref:Uncharacterized protein n=1 Tax=Euplotes crassus TaxID=5936 RepID=A0AAD1UJT3_EUPCR|nr:unnamed protein product [Moneuplotes crassus]
MGCHPYRCLLASICKMSILQVCSIPKPSKIPFAFNPNFNLKILVCILASNPAKAEVSLFHLWCSTFCDHGAYLLLN